MVKSEFILSKAKGTAPKRRHTEVPPYKPLAATPLTNHYVKINWLLAPYFLLLSSCHYGEGWLVLGY
jgi:hypothetical protein